MARDEDELFKALLEAIKLRRGNKPKAKPEQLLMFDRMAFTADDAKEAIQHQSPRALFQRSKRNLVAVIFSCSVHKELTAFVAENLDWIDTISGDRFDVFGAEQSEAMMSLLTASGSTLPDDKPDLVAVQRALFEHARKKPLPGVGVFVRGHEDCSRYVSLRAANTTDEIRNALQDLFDDLAEAANKKNPDAICASIRSFRFQRNVASQFRKLRPHLMQELLKAEVKKLLLPGKD